MDKKVVIITGASKGVGEATAILLSNNNFKVYAGSRDVENNENLKANGVITKTLDVGNDKSVKEFVDFVLSKEKRVDILINNAGYALFGPVETVNIADAQKEMNVNLFGVARVSQLIIPLMREQKEGLIINTVSALGKVPLVFTDWYTATKHALEGLSDCMRMELAPFNVKVVKINPATIKTAMYYDMSKTFMTNIKNTAYEKLGENMAKALQGAGNGALTPEDVAQQMLEVCEAKEVKPAYYPGEEAKQLIAMKKKASDEELDQWAAKLLGE